MFSALLVLLVESFTVIPMGADLAALRAEADRKVEQSGAQERGKESQTATINRPGSVWSQVGPKLCDSPAMQYYGTGYLSGRVNDVAVSPANPNNLYVATAFGGIWSSANAGASWKPLSDRWASLQTSTVAIHPANDQIVLAGTGDYSTNIGDGQGIMRSVDGGATWTQTGQWLPSQDGPSLKRQTCTRILFNPQNPTQVVAIGFTGSTTSNVWRSTDTGQTWTYDASLAGLGPFYDIELDPSNNLWLCTPYKVYKSIDYGLNWTAIYTVPSSLGLQCDLATSSLFPGTLYLLTRNQGKILKSTDYGSTWSDITGNHPWGTNGYNWQSKGAYISCVPQGGQDVVLVGLNTLCQSVGGNGVWQDITRSYASTGAVYTHEGHQNSAGSAAAPGTLYLATDGGVYRYLYSASPTQANFTSLNATLVAHECVSVTAGPSGNTQVLSGFAYGGTAFSPGILSDWLSLLEGTGGPAAFSDVTPNEIVVTAGNRQYFGASTAATVYRYPNGSSSTPQNITPPGFLGGGFPPVFYFNGQLYLAGRDLLTYVSGNTWTTAHSALEVNNHNAVATAIDQVNGAVYIGCEQGSVWRKTASTWIKIRSNNALPFIGISDIAVSSISGEVLIVEDGKVLRCSNPSSVTPTWSTIPLPGVVSPNSPLPKGVTADSVECDPYNVSCYYVGTEVGIVWTPDAGATWFDTSHLGLPRLRVSDLAISGDKLFLYAATFGRGVWRLPLTSLNSPYNISGTIRDGSSNPLVGANIRLKMWKETDLQYAGSSLSLPAGATTVAPINCTLSYAISSGVRIKIDISCPDRKDYSIELEAPDGRHSVVYNGSQQAPFPDINLWITLSQYATGMIANGTWKLRITNNGTSLGTLNSWLLRPKFLAYVTVGNTMSGPSGFYSFANLEPGKYLLEPTMTAKTFLPSYRVVNIGPNKALQDFVGN